jgi:hypothetical protein
MLYANSRNEANNNFIDFGYFSKMKLVLAIISLKKNCSFGIKQQLLTYSKDKAFIKTKKENK